MATPAGNRFWTLRSKHGREKLFTTSDLLWEAACEYFQWCDENPWLSKKATQRTVPVKCKKGKKEKSTTEQLVQQEVTPTARPYSLAGLCIYLGASRQWWNSFRKDCTDKNDEDFLEVIARVEDTIETQQFEGACVGAFNANIIARRLGLADKQEVDHTTGGQVFQGFGFLPYTPEAEKVK